MWKAVKTCQVPNILTLLLLITSHTCTLYTAFLARPTFATDKWIWLVRLILPNMHTYRYHLFWRGNLLEIAVGLLVLR